jgi:hypothetical protein
VVLRLVEQALDEGRIAGEVEMVETGARSVVGDAGELVAFVNSQRRLGPGWRVPTAPQGKPGTSP